jgi:hypothetical protein
MSSGKSRRPENQQRFDMLLDALLRVKAHRIGRAIRAEGKRMHRIL